MNDKPVLQINDLTIGVGGTNRKILDRVTIQVRAGETVCVVGESGSGKSVTSLATMGLLADGLMISGGTINVDGVDVLSASPRTIRAMRGASMAMVFQEPTTALNPIMRLSTQMDEVLRQHTTLSRAERREKILDMLEAVRLPDIKRIYNAFPSEISGGQRQRIAIAMALILKPRLLIADEPTTALDVTTQAQILSLIDELKCKNNTAVMFITHDLGVVAEIANQVVVMKRGEVVERASTRDILMSPQEAYTRALVSSVPSLVPRPSRNVASEVALTVCGISKRYTRRSFFGTKTVVDAIKDANLEIRRGEILGVVGESGSGKSTLARCVMRLTDLSSGRILVAGQEPSGQNLKANKAFRRSVQMVFQDPYRSLNPRVAIGESIIEGLVNFGVSKASALRRAEELVELVGLPRDTLGRFPHQFSGGQRQRICIARALALEPDVLVADEAVSALDVSVQAQVLKLFESIRDTTGTAILFITHDLRTAAQICDTILVMERGQVVEKGPATALLANPETAYTRSLLDAAPGRGWDFQNFQSLSKDGSVSIPKLRDS